MPTTESWTPPIGMNSKHVAEWRAFYRAIMVKYNMTPAQYEDLYIAQRGRCWICRTASGKNPMDPKARGGRRLGVDHNHITGQKRGLLCTGGDKTCNRIIGWLTAAALRRAAAYLDGTLTPGIVYEASGGNREITKGILFAELLDPTPSVVPGE